MPDLIQINIQAILDTKSEEKILSSINSIRNKISNNPFVIKVQTDSEALNAFASKIQAIGREANSSLQITPNISNGATKIIQTYNDEFTTLTRTVEETKLGIGQLKQVITTLDTESGNMVTSGSKIIMNLDQQRLATEKLIVAQNNLRASMSNVESMPISAKPLVLKADSLISGLNINSSVVDQQKAKLAVDEVTNAYRAQKEIENSLISAQNQLNALKDKELGKQQNLYDIYIRQQELQQQQNSNLLKQQMQEEANAEAEKLKTAELQRQIALYQEQSALQLRNMQAQYGNLARTPAIQSQISSVQGTVAGLNSSVLDAEGFRTQTAQINTAISSIRTNLNEARAASNNFASDLAHNAVKMLEWTVVGGLIFGALSKIKEGFSFINDLNKNMTNIAMITGKSHDSIVQMTKDYSDLASQLHETTSEIMTASEEFLRAGNSTEETAKLLEASTIMSKIAGQSQQDSAQSMISIMNAYHMSAEEMMGVVDKMVAVDNTSATSTAELSAAIQKTAASAQASGVSFSELVSWIGEVSSVSRQSASTIGTAFNSIFSRYENVKSGVLSDENGESLNNVEKVLNHMGIAIRDQQNNFLSFNDVLTKVANNWNKYNGVEQGAIATAIAGTRQHNQFLILMQNFNKTLELQTTEADSAGNALNRYSEYAKSTEAKFNDLTNASQQMWMNLIHSDTINSAITELTNLINTISHVTSTFGGLNTMLYTVIATFVIFKSKAIASIITSIGEVIVANESLLMSLIVVEGGLTKLGTAMTTLLTNPITIAIALVGGLTSAFVSYANQQQKIKEQIEATTKAQTDFNNSIQQFQNSLDPKKIDDVATSLENLKKAISYDDDLKQIDELKSRIQSIKDNMGNDSDQGDISLLPGLEQQLADLESKIKTVTTAQNEYNNAKKLATALDYESAQAQVQKISTTLQEINSQNQLIEKYQAVYDKMVQGKQLSQDEINLNNQLIQQYPQYTKVLNDKTSAVGVNIGALKANLTAQQALAITELESLKQTASANEVETHQIVENTKTRINAIQAEITALQARAEAYQGQSDFEQAQSEHLAMMNTGRLQGLLNTANQQLAEAQLTEQAWNTLSNLNPNDILNASNSSGSSGYMPPTSSSGSKTGSKSSSTASQPTYTDPTDAIVAQITQTSKLTETQNKQIQSDIDSAKSSKDYATELSKTNDLLKGQKTELSQLQEARSKLENQFATTSSNSGFQNTSLWFNADGSQSLYYIQQFNSASKDTQDQMSKTYDSLSKIRKAWDDAGNSISDTKNAIDNTKTSISQIGIDQFNDNISNLDAQLTQSKATMDLYDTSSEEYAKEQQNQISILQKKGIEIANEISQLEDQAKATDQTAESVKKLRDQINNLKLDYVNNQKSIIDTIQSKVKTIQDNEVSKLDTNYNNLDIQTWIKNNISATDTWTTAQQKLQTEIAKIGTPTTLAGQKEYNKLLTDSAKLTWDAYQAQVALQKQIDQARTQAVMDQADASLQAIQDQINNVDQTLQLSKGGTSSEVPTIDMNVVPKIDYNTADEAEAQVRSDNISNSFSDNFTVPTTFVNYINNDFTNALTTATNNIDTLKQKIDDLGTVTPGNKDQIIGYYQDIQTQIQSLSDVAQKAKDNLNLKLSLGEITQDDFNKAMAQVNNAELSVLAVPRLQMTAETQNDIDTFKAKVDAIPVDADTKAFDDTMLKELQQDYRALITVNIDSTEADTKLASLTAPAIKTILVQEVPVGSANTTSIPANAKGNDGTPADGYAKVDDGTGNEIIEEPNKTPYIHKDKGSKIVYLPKGTKIIPAEKSKEILKNNNIPAYETGNTGSIEINNGYESGNGPVKNANKGKDDGTTVVVNVNTNGSTTVGSNNSDSSSSSSDSETNQQIDLINQKIALYQILVSTASESIATLTAQIAPYRNADGTYQENDITKEIVPKIQSALNAQKAAQTAIKQLIQDKYNAEFDIYDVQKKQNDELEKMYTFDLEITKALHPENYTAINNALVQQQTQQQKSLDFNISTLDSLTKQRDKLYDSTKSLSDQSDEWNILNGEVETYQQNVESSAQAIQATNQALLKNSLDQFLNTTEKSIFGGQTEAQASYALQEKQKYQQEYISGAEKEAEIARIQNELLQNNADLNGGILDSQNQQLQFTQEQLALLNQTGDIKRSDLDILEKELAVQKTQAEIANAGNQKTIQQLTKDANGNWNFDYVADSSKILSLQGQLYQEQQDLESAKNQNTLQAQQDQLNAQEDYWNNVKTIVQNAENGQYSSTQEFTNDMNTLNNSFLSQFNSDTKTQWDKWVGTITSSLSTVTGALQTYIDAESKLSNSITSTGISGTSVINSISTPSNWSSMSGNDKANWLILHSTPEQKTQFNSDATSQSVDFASMTDAQKSAWIDKEVNKFADGGETESTGFHWLDGDMGKPERVLSSEQTVSFNKLVDMLPNLNLNSLPIKNAFDSIKTFDLSSSISNIVGKVAQQIPNQTFHIDNISFPNITDSTGLQDAFNDLPLLAAQKAKQQYGQ